MKRLTSSRSINLRTVLGALIAMLLVSLFFAVFVLFRNAEATAEMRKEAREVVLLSAMDASVEAIAIRVDEWFAVSGDDPQSIVAVLDSDYIQENLKRFGINTSELSDIIKPEEQHLVDNMQERFKVYETALVNIATFTADGPGTEENLHEEVHSIERSVRTSMHELQNEEIEHLEQSVLEARSAENLLRFLVPSLLVVALGLTEGIRRLSARARQVDDSEALYLERTAFIASISHELRTPLTAVVGLASELSSSLEHFDAAEIEEFTTVIASESEEVAGIVEDLLVAARAEVESLTILEEVVDLGSQLERVLRSSHFAQSNSIVSKVDGTILANADGARVRQILRNLLSNAERYGGDQIEVAIATANGTTITRVSDDGPGIAPEDQKRVFRPFERAHSSRGVPASVGLGLSVSKELARQMGGDLQYRYDDKSTFELTLPSAEGSLDQD